MSLVFICSCILFMSRVEAFLISAMHTIHTLGHFKISVAEYRILNRLSFFPLTHSYAHYASLQQRYLIS